MDELRTRLSQRTEPTAANTSGNSSNSIVNVDGIISVAAIAASTGIPLFEACSSHRSSQQSPQSRHISHHSTTQRGHFRSLQITKRPTGTLSTFKSTGVPVTLSGAMKQVIARIFQFRPRIWSSSMRRVSRNCLIPLNRLHSTWMGSVYKKLQRGN